jgi:5'-nucleotidase
VHILVTNDDGVHAPGLAAIARALDTWVAEGDPAEDRSVVVVAPLANNSGASAAVGTVFEREAIGYRRSRIEGADDVAVFGVDATPALATIIGVLGAFGPRPDLIMSGINLGVNVGRSVLHSGTVGAVLTGAQLGVSGLAVSMRSGAPVEHWETAATLAVSLQPRLALAPPRTVLNLNVPSVPLHELRGVRRGRISTAGIIKGAANRNRLEAEAGSGRSGRVVGGPASGGDEEEGEIVLKLGAAVPSLGDVGDEEPDDDGALVAAGFAALTPLRGVREDTDAGADELVRAALADMGTLLGRS